MLSALKSLSIQMAFGDDDKALKFKTEETEMNKYERGWEVLRRVAIYDKCQKALELGLL